MNDFRKKLESGEKLCGLWLGNASAYMTEVAVHAGYDWYLIDGEHAPSTITTVFGQLCSLDCHDATGIVRILDKDVALVKQALDVGAKTILVPMVDTKEEAELMQKACKYPPNGIRGVGGYIIRAGQWGADANYQKHADEDIFLIVQCETKAGLDNLEDILKIDGIDSVFLGPADLSANLGFESMEEEGFKKIWFEALKMIKSSNKYVGTLATNEKLAKETFAHGADFVGVEVDVVSYLRGLKETLKLYK